MSGAYLQYGSTRLFDSPSNVTLTVETANQRVYCVQATGPVPTSIEWFNPEGQLVSRDNKKEVTQVTGTGGGRGAILNFRSYQQSLGGAYECRVAGPGNNLERVLVCIGECYTFFWLSSLQLAIMNFFVPSIHHLYYVHPIQTIAHVVASLIELCGGG